MSNSIKNLRIFVVCGGISSEREVSIKSGKAVSYALTDYGYTNVSIFYLEEDNLNKLIEQKPDLVYIALHGKGGEDGSVQGALDLAGIKYTGPGVAASALCMDKVLTKYVLAYHNIPTPKFSVYHFDEYSSIDEIRTLVFNQFHFPVVIKAPDQGSSIGVYIVRNEEALRNALVSVKQFGKRVLVEEFINGKEITLPILGNEELIIFPEIEIVSMNQFYDYDSKYTNGMSHHIIPASITNEVREKIIDVGKKAYRVLGCKGISRIDFLVHPERGPLVLEVNTSPGMTEMSLFPDAASKYGISFGELANTIVKLALDN